MRSVRAMLALCLLAAGVATVAPASAAARPPCDVLDVSLCLLPFPNDVFTKADPTTATGKRVDFQLAEMPRNLAGKPIDPSELNRQDGFSPGSMALTFVPGIDLYKTWGVDGMADPRVGSPTDPRDTIADPDRSLAADAPIMLISATTGQRWPFFDELDRNAFTQDGQRILIIRPLVNFREGHRYIVALRNLKDGNGAAITAGPGMRAFQLGAGLPLDRQAHYTNSIFPELSRHNVTIDESLYLAWDFTIASGNNLASRALHLRDDALELLGDESPASGIDGNAPQITITKVTDFPANDPNKQRRIEGTIRIPNYLDRDPTPTQCSLDGAQYVQPNPVSGSPANQCQAVPGARLYYGTDLVLNPDAAPRRNPVIQSFEAPFTCQIPATATASNPAHGLQYGHGLLGNISESQGSSTDRMRERNFLTCATYWMGFAFYDVANAVVTLNDPSNMASMADKSLQGFVNKMYLQRAMRHPQGFASLPAFQDGSGNPLLDHTKLAYDGNSQGGIMGGALCALSVDLQRCTLGVPGMNYSTLLNRSVDWELPGIYSVPLYAQFPNKLEQQLVMAQLQMLWDRAEGNGYAQHMTDDPLPNTPPHQVMLHVAWGDFQVTNVAAEVEARTIGARFLDTSLPIPDQVTGLPRYWGVGGVWGIQGFDRNPDNSVKPHNGSALVYWDSGNLPPPNWNVPPTPDGGDPHEDPRRDHNSADQRDLFFRTGLIHDVVAGGPYLACNPNSRNSIPRVPSQFTIGDWCP